jgi:hypothetical protein
MIVYIGGYENTVLTHFEALNKMPQCFRTLNNDKLDTLNNK